MTNFQIVIDYLVLRTTFILLLTGDKIMIMIKKGYDVTITTNFQIVFSFFVFCATFI